MAQDVTDTLRGKNPNPNAPVNVKDRDQRPVNPAVQHAIPAKGGTPVFNVKNDKPVKTVTPTVTPTQVGTPVKHDETRKSE